MFVQSGQLEVCLVRVRGSCMFASGTLDGASWQGGEEIVESR